MELGETLSGTDSSSNLINRQWLGQKFLLPSPQETRTPRSNKNRLSGKGIWAVLLRNTTGAALLPKQIATLGTGYDSTHECYGHEEAEGLAVTIAAGPSVIVDPWLPSGGVADNDIFWGVLEGMCLVKTPTTHDLTQGDIAAGAPLVAATLNTTAGNTTAGRISNITLAETAAATNAYSMAKHLIGYALSAKTTAETDEDILIRACIQY